MLDLLDGFKFVKKASKGRATGLNKGISTSINKGAGTLTAHSAMHLL